MIKDLIERFRVSPYPLVRSVYNFSRQLMYGFDRTGEWKFVSMPEYVAMVHEWIKQLPKTFNIVVAVPRSGLIAGTAIATELNKPLTTPLEFVVGRVWGIGGVNIGRESYGKETTILLVDDSLGTGYTMQWNYNRIKMQYPDVNIITAALFCRFENRDLVDYSFYRHVDNTRLIFDFNLTRITYGELACDMDGVLCDDYVVELSEQEYIEWMKNVHPYRIPKFRIQTIITNRKEKYRDITEKWLAKYKVRYDNLIMNTGNENVLIFKATALRKCNPAWYWESDPAIALLMFKETGTPTLCINTGEMYAV
jgi:hypoxanthine phosphoribosyltransferase